MRYRQIAVTILLGAFGPYAAAQDLLGCVDPDVRAGLLGSAFGGGQAFTSERIRFFDDFVVPAGLSYIGGAESDAAEIAAFKSGLAPDAAVAAVADALAATDWRPMPGSSSSRAATGFIVGVRPAAMTMFCRDAEMLTVVSGRQDGSTYVRLSSVRNGGIGCPQLPSGPADPQQHVFDLSEFMPRLEMPRDGTGQRGAGGYTAVLRSSTSRAQEARTANVRIVTSRDADSLAAFFAEQLRGQDWQLDADWSGRLAAGSAWTASRVREENGERIELVGLLDVAARGADRYDAQFRLLRIEE